VTRDTQRPSRTENGRSKWTARRAAADTRCRQAGLLASKLHLFQPLDGFALVGDNLRLPDKRDGHEAHGDDTQNEDEADAGLLSGKP